MDVDINEVRVEHLSLAALNPFVLHNSSARSVMSTSHFAQHLVLSHPTPKYVLSGVEHELSKYTFDVEMPANGRIIKVMQRYPRGVDKDYIPFNPETIVIYENDETGEIDYFSLPLYNSFHQYFGFEYLYNDNINKIKQNAYIKGGTKFATSSSSAGDKTLKYGCSLNTAYMSLPGVAEDGVIISEAALDKLSYKIYERRTVQFGSKYYPLNLYGTEDVYKPFPEIGEYVKEDGLLMCLRSYDTLLSPVEMSRKALMKQDYIFDRATYSRPGKGKVIDIQVIANNEPKKNLPPGMSDQTIKYQKALKNFYNELIQLESRLRYEHKKKYGNTDIKLSNSFRRLLFHAYKIIGPQLKGENNSILNLTFKKEPLDEYRIDFVIEYETRPDIGHKLTDIHGGKGVICAIWPKERMPKDKDGNIAEIVTDDLSVISRMNIGKLYEQYFSGACVHITKQLKRMLGCGDIRHGEFYNKVTNTYSTEEEQENYLKPYIDFLFGFYNICSPKQYQKCLTLNTEDKIRHMDEVLSDGVRLVMLIDEQKSHVDMYKEIEANELYRPTHDTVTFGTIDGRTIQTVNKVRIAPIYYMLLDKIVDDGSSVNTARLQHFGVLSPATKAEKFSQPYRPSPVRIFSETEARIAVEYLPPISVAETMDRANNPQAQSNAVWNILDSDQPGNIDRCVNRDFVSYGNNKPLSLMNHVIGCAGFKFVYVPEQKVVYE